METSIVAAVVLSSLAAAGVGVVVACAALFFGFVSLILFWWYETRRPLHLSRFKENPILEPNPAHWWESEAVFNPTAFLHNGRVHLLYRALGRDGVSRIGYASSYDGIHFDERSPHPAYDPDFQTIPDPRKRYGPLTYSTVVYASGGGWGGSEDPRAVKMEGNVYMTFTAFEGWASERINLTSLPVEQFENRVWAWKKASAISPPGEVHKNWLLFPEKINGKYAILHSISPKIAVEYFDDFSVLEQEGVYIKSPGRIQTNREGHWDAYVRGAGAPPLKTRFGWLLFYHGFDPAHSEVGYKVGVMLLDLQDPTKVLARSNAPILEPKEWYENDWKPGVVYASGAVVLGDNLFVYYGGGDKRIAAARANLRNFVYKLLSGEHAVLEPVKI